MIRIGVALTLALTAGVAEAHSHCHEASPIVGRQRCAGFGARWAHAWWLGLFGYEASVVLVHASVPAIDETGVVYSPDTTAGYHAHLAPGTRRTLWGLGPRQRFGYRGPHLELGIEAATMFALDAPTLITEIDGLAPYRSASGFVFDGTGVVGVHTRFSRLELGGEIASGVRRVALPSSLPNGFTSCMNGGTGKGCGFAVGETDLLIEARVRADLWIHPQVTMGIAVGLDLTPHGETFALTFAYHPAVYDGS